MGKTGLILFFKVNYQFRKLTIYNVEDKSKTLKREEIEFLNFVDENAKMGVNSIKQLTDLVNNKDFKNMLESQLLEYKLISEKTNELIKKNSEDKIKENIDPIKKVQIYLMINIKTLLNKTPDNIAAMLMQGSVMGIIQIIRRLKQYKNKINPELVDLGEKLLKIEETNLLECKKFLGVMEN